MSPLSNFLSPKCLYLSHHWLTKNAPNLTYSDLGFKKFSRGETPAFRGPLRGGEGEGKEGRGRAGP